MIVQHNISSMNANRQLGITTGKVKTSTEKLSSGYRVNKAADDAAGLAISEKMRGQIRGLKQASTNAENGISLIQTAEGALQETQNIVQRMRELAVQAASDTNTQDDREQIQQEIVQLTQEVDRIANNSEYNTKKLLDGSMEGSKSFRSGIGSAEGTFVNGEVSVIQNDVSDNATIAVDDVIRIEFTKDGEQAEDIGVGYNIASLRGTEVTYDASEGLITITDGKYDLELDELRATDSNTAADSVGEYNIYISGFANIKAGDTITINLQKATLTRPQVTGREALRVQVGANGGQEAFLGVSSMKARDLGLTQTSVIRTLTTEADNETYKENEVNIGAALDVTTQAMASLAIEAYDNALQKVSNERANLGALQNRLEHSINNLDTSAENLQDAESRIRDVDMADEMTEYSKYNILMQAGQSMLAQANQMTQGVLNLLQ